MSADQGADAGADMSGEGRWLTYDELGRTRGIDRLSAAKLAARHRWRRQKDNRGAVQVLVPIDWLTRQRASVDLSAVSFPGVAPDASADVSLLVEALKAAQADVIAVKDAQITLLADQLVRAEQGADAADADRRRAEERAEAAEVARERAEAALAAECVRADALRERAEALQVGLTEAEEVATRAVAELKDAQEAAEALGQQVGELRAGQELLGSMHADDLTAAQAAATAALQAARQEAQVAQDAAAGLLQADDARKARGRWARLRAAWRRE